MVNVVPTKFTLALVLLTTLLWLGCAVGDVQATRVTLLDCLEETDYPSPPWYNHVFKFPPWSVLSGDHDCQSEARDYRDAVYDNHAVDDPKIKVELRSFQSSYLEKLRSSYYERLYGQNY